MKSLIHNSSDYNRHKDDTYNENISYNDHINVISDVKFVNNSKQIKIIKNKLYTKHRRITETNNTLVTIRIETNKQNDIKTSFLFAILKKHIPTIFNADHIKNRNINNVLQNDFEIIYKSACVILGEEEIKEYDLQAKLQKNTVESLEKSFELISSYDAFSST
ncbi:hypothetical protein BDAP_002053 [Binucleata daphniae]